MSSLLPLVVSKGEEEGGGCGRGGGGFECRCDEELNGG